MSDRFVAVQVTLNNTAPSGHQVMVRIHDDGTVEVDDRQTDARVWTPVHISGGSFRVMMPSGDHGSRITDRVDTDFLILKPRP